MINPATNGNRAHHYVGKVDLIISSYEGHLTFCGSDEGYWIHTRNSTRLSECSVHYLIKSSHDTQS